MNLMTIKKQYWRALAAWNRWRHPVSTSYSPHDWMDAIARNLPDELRVGEPFVPSDPLDRLISPSSQV